MDVPVWGEANAVYRLDVTIEDHRCPTRSQVPHATYGIKSAAGTISSAMFSTLKNRMFTYPDAARAPSSWNSTE